MNPISAKEKILKCYDFYIDRQVYLQNFKNDFYKSKSNFLSYSISLFKNYIDNDDYGHPFSMMIYYLESDGDILIPTHSYYNLVNKYNIKNLSENHLAIALILYKLKDNKNFKYYNPAKFFNLLDNEDNIICNELWNNYFTV